MVRNQLVTRGIRDARVLAAMETVHREQFVPNSLGSMVYEDCALPIGEGQTISQPFTVAETFTGQPGKYVKLQDTVRGFKGIVAGDYDELPEQAFYMVGTIEEAVEKSKTM